MITDKTDPIECLRELHCDAAKLAFDAGNLLDKLALIDPLVAALNRTQTADAAGGRHASAAIAASLDYLASQIELLADPTSKLARTFLEAARTEPASTTKQHN